jgi:uncharacterized coiled-coil protein SlyX
METEERLSRLEEKLAAHDRLIARLIAFARETKKGRILLAMLGVDDL